ncbi:hypothetical protein APSETT444_007076 [Aspergillus pseudonomiae]
MMEIMARLTKPEVCVRSSAAIQYFQQALTSGIVRIQESPGRIASSGIYIVHKPFWQGAPEDEDPF